MLEGTAYASDDPLEVVEWKPKAEDTARKTWTKEFLEKVQAIIEELQANQVRQVADLNLLDYFIWSCVENITNMTSHNTKASLITATHQVFAELLPALVEKACSQFWIRIEAVIEAEGGYIE